MKSGYEIKIKEKEKVNYFDIMNSCREVFIENEKTGVVINLTEIAAIIVKHWYQKWD